MRSLSPIVRRWAPLLVAPLAALLLGACSLAALPVPDATPTPCSGNCPPPQRDAGAAHTVRTRHFTLTYYDPWSVQNTDATSITLAAGTQFGDVTVLIQSADVRAGTSAAQILNTTAQNELDPNQFSGLQDNGPIRGAEVGYVAGAGESFAGYTSQANAPNVPVYIEMMASVHGTTSITFTAVSPLDPNSPDPNIVPNAEYDHLVNSVVWQ
jgi:hypothetical protein